MRIVFPLKNPENHTYLNSLEHYNLNEKTSTEKDSRVVGGWYPVGKNRFWHGGVHLDGDFPIHAIAKGTIIAYRLTDKYKKFDYTYKITVKGSEQDRKLYNHPLSDNFVLIRHDEVEPVKGYKVPFYSLYMHLQPFDKNKIGEKEKGYPPYFYGYRCVVNCTEFGDGLELLAPEKIGSIKPGYPFYIIPKGGYVTDISSSYEKDHGKTPGWVTWINKKGKAEYRPVEYGSQVGFIDFIKKGDKYKYLSNVGGNVYEVTTDKAKLKDNQKGMKVFSKNPLGHPGVVGILKNGEEIQFCTPSEAIDPKTGKITPGFHDFSFNGNIRKVSISETNVKTVRNTVDPILNSIQECEIPIEAGAIIGWTGEIGVEKDRKSVHFETFCKKIDFMEGRTDDKDKKTIVKVPQTATFKDKDSLDPCPPLKLVKDHAELKAHTPTSKCGTFPTVHAREVSIVFKREGWLKYTDMEYDKSTGSYTLLKDVEGMCSNHPAKEKANATEIDVKVKIKKGEKVYWLKSDSYTKPKTNAEHKKMAHRLVKYILPDVKQTYKQKRFIKDRNDVGAVVKGHYQLKKDLEKCFYKTSPEAATFSRDFVTDASEKQPLKYDFYLEKKHCKECKDQDGNIWWGIPLPVGSTLAGQIWHNPDCTYDKIGWIMAYKKDAPDTLLAPFELLSPYTWPGFHKKDERTMTDAEKAEYNADANDFICDISEIIKMVDTDTKDGDFQEKEINQAISKTATADRLRGAVVNFRSEWFCPKSEGDIKAKFERLTKPPWGFKTDLCEAFGKVFKDLSFMQQLKDFKDNPPLWYFHPISFISHLMRLAGARDILNAKARERGIKKIKENDNIWAYYKGYELVTAGDTLVPKHEPEKGGENNSLGYYLVKREVRKGITTYSGKESKSQKEGLDLLKEKKISESDWRTFCNLAATTIAVAYGAPNLEWHKGTDPKATDRNVNAIVELLKNKAYDTDECQFQKVDYKEAEDYARRGGFAFAIRKGGGPHGHIATLIGGYKDDVVSVANINTFQAGTYVGQTTVGIGFRGVIEDIKFYIWRRK